MIWTPLAMVPVALSSAGSALIVVKLWRDWDVRLSSVRWLFLHFFLYLWLYTTGRLVQYAWLVSLPADEVYAASDALTATELDKLGAYMSIYLSAVKTPWVTAVLCFCDAAHFGAAFWVLPLTYELAQIAAKNMDRGVAKEQRQIKLYALVGHALTLGFLAVQVSIAVRHGGYSKQAYHLVLAIYIIQVSTLAYMAGLLAALRCKGRNVEAVDGHFEASPVYRRLLRIMLVYALFALQYEVSSLSLYWKTPSSPGMFTFIALSQIVYNSTAFALALITGCSLPCVLRFGAWCLPEDVEAELMELRGGEDALLRSAVATLTPHNSSNRAPPVASPVFVVTDIESSSALWGVDDGRVMQRAVEMHDDILRSLLAKYRGYEITTAGDSFQLAFHTIREAVEYSLAVQMELLAAKWPKELFGLVPATKSERALTHQPLFRGLRVRMGIHDALVEQEGPLVVGVHAVTGKTTYSGVSFEIASEVGDLGAGGQILATRRIADWLEDNDWLLETRVAVDRVAKYVIPHTSVAVELFQVLPQRLYKRARFFSNRDVLDRASRSDSRVMLELSASGEGTLPASYTSDGWTA